MGRMGHADTELVGDDALEEVEEALEMDEDDGIKLEPFNLAQERQEGFFDDDGHYVERRDKDDEEAEKDAWFVSTRGKEQVRIVAAQTEFPLVRHASDHTPRDLLLEAGGEYRTNTVIVPTEHHAMASFARDPNISQPPPVEIEFIDPLDNRWHLSTDRTLTLLTPRTIAATRDDLTASRSETGAGSRPTL